MGTRIARLREVLAGDLRTPVYLTPDEAEGGWTEVFPELATSLPAPFPIFAPDEEQILAFGYPVEVTDALLDLRELLTRHVSVETEHQVRSARGRKAEKGSLVAPRRESLGRIAELMENALLSDYGRGMFEVLVLQLSTELAQRIVRVPKLVVQEDVDLARREGERIRFLVARSFADLLQRAGHEASDRIRALAESRTPRPRSHLLTQITQDLLPLALEGPPRDFSLLNAYLEVQFRYQGPDLMARGEGALLRLRDLFGRKPDLSAVFRFAVGRLDLDQDRAFLQPRLWTALRSTGLLERIGLPERDAELFTNLGMRLKRLEVIAAARRHLTGISVRGKTFTVISRRPSFTISPSTRPLDFARPGVVDSAVRRFGLVYDLTSFTETLEEVRKQGRRAEEQALQFMYIFQRHLDEIRRRRRLNFEKFLGDGAFYSSRRASRVIAAACEIQQLYDRLRSGGFPFNKGIRMAMNFGTYQLLPMMPGKGEEARFEFFGHGVVELLRLTTGKSTREIEEIAEFLVYSGYSPAAVDSFLTPLADVRSGGPEGSPRPYTVRIDEHGELVNEGLALTSAMVEELEQEAADRGPIIADAWDLRWAVYTLREADSPEIHVGLRFVGVARLKGLPPLEIVEATPWPGPAEAGEPVVEPQPLVSLLRSLAGGGADDDRERLPEIPPDIVVATYLDADEQRHWVFGRYRAGDDVLLHVIEVPIQPPDIEEGEPLEVWLFRNRHELVRLYDGLRRENPGVSMPLEALRHQDGYLGSFLAAPHRSPE